MAKKHNIELTQELLWEILHYDPETGFLYWKEREPRHFSHLVDWLAIATCKTFNKKQAGKLALHGVMTIGYRAGGLFDVKQYAHRIIWFMFHGEWPKVIDHENGNKLDNRIENLRNVTQRENTRNAAKKRNNKTGVSGVQKLPGGRFHVSCHLGSFENFDEAVKIRFEAEEILGESRVRRKPGGRNKSGVNGVHQITKTGMWTAVIALGSFDTLEEATARKKWANETWDYHKNHGREAVNES